MENFQIVSFAEGNTSSGNPEHEFYNTPRLNFLEDQKMGEVFLRRLITKFPVFHSLFMLVKGANTEHTIYNKFCLNKFVLTASRLKIFRISFFLHNSYLQFER